MVRSATLGVSKGASEAISRQLRVTAKSNDSPQDRVRLFWEIKSSADRFAERRKITAKDHAEARERLRCYKRKGIEDIAKFKR